MTSEPSRTNAAFILELTRIVLIVAETKRAQRALSRYLFLNPSGHPSGSWGQIAQLQPVLVAALGDHVQRWYAVILLLAGVVSGFDGNLLTLPHGLSRVQAV